MPSNLETNLNVDELKNSLQIQFGFFDYFVFALMLIISSIIGYYFGFIKKRTNNNEIGKILKNNDEALNYLIGDRKMKIIPISLSLVASYLSGIALIGDSTEIYVYGTQFFFTILTILLSAIFAWYFFLPIFCNLQMTSLYQYLEMRFDRKIRFLGSIVNVIGIVLWLSMVIYIPGLVFNQVTGFDVHVITPIVCFVCIFYTCVGGLKAVVWTDVFQSFIMLLSVGLVAIKGTIDIGGIGEVFKRNYHGDRLEYPQITFDPTVRFSIFSVLIGGTMSWTQDICCSQIMMQRFLSVPSIKEARKVLIIFMLGIIILLTICVYNGLLIFATYHKCDPLSTTLANVKDQLLPLLVMDVLGKYPGLTGIFVAGIISAALSTLSTGLNSLSAIFFEDLFKQFYKKQLTNQQTKILMRIIVIIFGIICYSLVTIIEKLGMILQLSQTLNSVTTGPIFGIFIMGVFMPWINSKSALSGGIFSFSIMLWYCIRAQISITMGEMVHLEKPLTTNGCSYSFNSTLINEKIELNFGESTNQTFHHISFMWYSTVGSLLAIIGGNLTMIFFGKIQSNNWNSKLIAPFLRKFIILKNFPVDNQLETFIAK